MTKMFALTTDQGTAMSETAICDNHWKKSFDAIRRDAQFIADWDRLDFVDCSGNAALECTLCGATADECHYDVRTSTMANNDYRRAELEHVDANGVYSAKIKIESEAGYTKWLDISATEFEQIKAVLLDYRNDS